MSHAAPGGLRLGLLMQRWPDAERPLGAMTPFAETVSELAAGEGVAVIVFAPADVEGDSVRAIAWQNGCWCEQPAAPLPDVIWHRYLGPDRELALQRILRLGVPVFNESALSKWEAHQVLQADPILKDALPETRLLESVGDIADMGRRHAELYLKPVDGAVGRGIIRASLQPTGLIRLQYVAAAGRVRIDEARLSQMERWVAAHRGRYVVQQGLDLKVFYGRAADLRLLMQKAGDGRWALTGMGARVAANGRFTANLHTGGTGVPASMLAAAVFPDDPERQELLLLELQALGARAAEALEPAAGLLGELGLDFAVDRQGRTWYIEQNALPGRALFEHLSRPDLSRLAHLRPIQFARRLASTKSAKAAGYRAT